MKVGWKPIPHKSKVTIDELDPKLNENAVLKTAF